MLMNPQSQVMAAQKMMRTPQTELCVKHGETNVAYNEKTKEIYCNSCIFEKKVSELKFTAIVVKELKEKFAREFLKYKESMS